MTDTSVLADDACLVYMRSHLPLAFVSSHLGIPSGIRVFLV